MYCTTCSFPIEECDRFCGQCGRKTPEGKKLGRHSARALARATHERKVAGVCEGFARYFDVDVTLVRLGWAGVSLLPFMPGLIAYAVCWAVMPADQAVRGHALSL